MTNDIPIGKTHPAEAMRETPYSAGPSWKMECVARNIDDDIVLDAVRFRWLLNHCLATHSGLVFHCAKAGRIDDVQSLRAEIDAKMLKTP